MSFKLKRTALYIPIANVRNKGILTVNYHCEENSVSGDDIYEKILDDLRVITEGKPSLNIRYYISCNIVLKNQTTSTLRVFNGHFSFNDENVVALSQFNELKSKEDLKNEVESALTPQNLDRVLIQPYLNSSYTFQKIQAVVISFQIYTSSEKLYIIHQCKNKVVSREL